MTIKINFMRINMPIKSRILCRLIPIYAASFKFMPIEMAFWYLAATVFGFALSIFVWV